MIKDKVKLLLVLIIMILGELLYLSNSDSSEEQDLEAHQLYTNYVPNVGK